MVTAPQIGVLSRLGLDFLAFGMTCAVALFWEFAEYLVDVNFGSRMQRGLDNTMRDLALGVVGGLTYITVNRVRGRAESRP